MKIRMTWAMYRGRVCAVADKVGGRYVQLTPTEAEILSTLILRRGHTVSFDEMIEAVYPNPDHEPEWPLEVIKVFICRLRRKLPGIIETIWGRGYLIEAKSLYG